MNKRFSLMYGLVVLGIVWYLSHWLIDPRIIPSPFNTLLNTIELIVKGTLLKHVFYSFYRLIIAIGVALLLGIIIGIILGVNDKVDQLVSPVIYIIFPIPKAAFLPVLFVLLGLGDKSKIVLIVSILVFQIIVSIRDSVKSISETIFLSAKSLGMRKIDMFKHILIPAVLPSIITSLRISTGIGIAVLFFTETYATQYGIGYFIMDSWSLINYVDMYTGIIMLGIMGSLLFKCIDYIEKKYVDWTI